MQSSSSLSNDMT